MQDDLVTRQQAEIETLREKVRQLQDALVPPDVVIPIEWHLTSTEARVFAFLTTREIATKPAIMHALYSDRYDEPLEKIVDVLICKLRKKVKKYGIQIETIWGTGYALVDRQKMRSAA